MVELRKRYETYLYSFRKNLIPKDASTGLELRNVLLSGNSESKLNDAEVEVLCKSLEGNTTFNGSIFLAGNGLTDQASLAIAELIKTNKNIRALTLSHNPAMTFKTAKYLAEALLAEPYPIQHLELEGINLGELGTRYICELLVENKDIKFVDIGVVGDSALKLIGEFALKFLSLESMKIEESEAESWTEPSMEIFSRGFKSSEVLLDCKIDSSRSSSMAFAKEIAFHCRNNRENKKKREKLEVFDHPECIEKQVSRLIQTIESKEGNKHLPVRVYIANTGFGTLLNDALYDLQRERRSNPKKEEIRTVPGSVRYIAKYLLDHIGEDKK